MQSPPWRSIAGPTPCQRGEVFTAEPHTRPDAHDARAGKPKAHRQSPLAGRRSRTPGHSPFSSTKIAEDRELRQRLDMLNLKGTGPRAFVPMPHERQHYVTAANVLLRFNIFDHGCAQSCVACADADRPLSWAAECERAPRRPDRVRP